MLLTPHGTPIPYSRLMYTIGLYVSSVEVHRSLDVQQLRDDAAKLNRLRRDPKGEFWVDAPTIQIFQERTFR